MSEAPERIWIDGDETGLEIFLYWTWQRGSWNRSKEGVGEVEYIRADLLPTQSTLLEATDPDFIFEALDNVHDMDVSLRDYANSVSKTLRAFLNLPATDETPS